MNRERKQRGWWTRDWLLLRTIHGHYEALMAELRLENLEEFNNFVRVDVQIFQELLHVLGERITKKRTWSRQTIDPGLRLAITLRYLATGDSYQTFMYGFRVAHNTISGIIWDVCKAIVATYAGDVINTPTEPEQWKVIAENFKQNGSSPIRLVLSIANIKPIIAPRHFKLLVLILTTSY